MESAKPDTDLLTDRARRFFEYIPHGRLLGLEVIKSGRGSLQVKLPYSTDIVGNPYVGFIHSGALTVLIDQTSGAAVILALQEGEMVATLDLRVDHLRPAQAGKDMYAQAECYRLTRELAFVRCVCYENDPADAVATSMSTFMRTGVRRLAQSSGGDGG